MMCKYCGKEYKNNGNNKDVCGTCGSKVPLLPKFIEARDAARQRLGLKPMGSKHYGWW